MENANELLTLHEAKYERALPDITARLIYFRSLDQIVENMERFIRKAICAVC